MHVELDVSFVATRRLQPLCNYGHSWTVPNYFYNSNTWNWTC